MPQIIASTYEIIKEIGAGGGGVVYLGRHLRLDKLIVLKADKRSLKASPEMLRREVDALKNLTHTYIPQVYDFVQENGVVYTVMDYIEGSSLDKLLEQKRQFTLPDVVKWSCQMLEALQYLHSRPPYGILHSDIKPANIMLTPQGDIRLIDFNIALALGEDGAVRVGRSRGYASPEHYGYDYSSLPRSGTTVENSHETEVLDGGTAPAHSRRRRNTAMAPRGKNSTVAGNSLSYRSSTTSGGTVLLDRRSDIYSLGATLYHLLTGEHPAEKAVDVRPITQFPVNPVVARIVQKAMNPNPDLRYQSAEEMLYDFRHLHELDSRTKRHKAAIGVMAAVIAVTVLLGSGMVYIGQQQRTRLLELEQLSAQSIAALRNGDKQSAVSLALQALPEKRDIYNPPWYVPDAQSALAGALGVYDLRGSYRAWKALPLPAEPVKIRISADGKTGACLVRDGSVWRVMVYDLETGRKIAEPEAAASPLAEIQFLENGTLLFAGTDGMSALDTASGVLLWSTRQPATDFSVGEKIAAAVSREDDEAYLYDIETGRPVGEPISFEEKRMRVPVGMGNGEFGQKMALFALDEDGERLAVSFEDGSVTIFDLQDSNNTVSLPPSDYTHFDGCFCGDFFALSRFRSGTADTLFEVYDFSDPDNISLVFEPLTGVDPLTGERDREYFYNVLADDTALYVSNLKALFRLEMTELSYELLLDLTDTDETVEGFQHTMDRTVVWTSGGRYLVMNRYGQILDTGTADEGEDSAGRCAVSGDYLLVGNGKDAVLWVRKQDDYGEAQVLSYDSSYAHQEARIRTEEGGAVLFSNSGFRIVDRSGDELVTIPWDENATYDPQYRRPGDTDFQDEKVTGEKLEIRFKDGRVVGYSVQDGSVLYEIQGEAPDQAHSVNRFTTADHVILSVNHGAPEIYEPDGETLVKRMEGRTHLAYAYQTGDNLILIFNLQEEDRREGVLLDRNLDEIAELPLLNDVLPDGTLIFDDTLGNLRQSRIYSIEELITMAEEKEGGSV